MNFIITIIRGFFKKVKEDFSFIKNEILSHEDEQIKRYNRYTGKILLLLLLIVPFSVKADSLVPVMTGATTPSGEISSDLEYLTYYAYKAFDNGSDHYYAYPVASPYASNVFVQVDLGVGTTTTLTSYGITPYNSMYAPKGFDLSGSNDGSTWILIDSQSGLSSGWTSHGERTFSTTTTVGYRYYKFLFNDFNSPSDHSLEIEQMQLYGSLSGGGGGSGTSTATTTPATGPNTEEWLLVVCVFLYFISLWGWHIIFSPIRP